jgi:hypothetical protein
MFFSPVPPRSKLFDLFLFIRVLKKVENRIVKAFRVGGKICS